MMCLQIGPTTFLCNAHLLRDYKEFIDSTEKNGPKQMQGFLRSLHLKKQYKGTCQKWSKRIGLPSINLIERKAGAFLAAKKERKTDASPNLANRLVKYDE